MIDAIDRLRANLRAAGIPATDDDLAGIQAKGFLSRLADFERITADLPTATVPDYLDAGALPTGETGREDEGAREQEGNRGTRGSPSTHTLLGAAAALRRGATSALALTEQALAEVARRDPQLNAVQLLLAEAAMRQAREADAELAAGQDRGPLHGVPVAVKDLLDMAGLPTAAGSTILAGALAAEDATAVAKLRAAGAVIVAKTRLSEFAYSPGSNNAHYGPTANPFDPTRDTGGSSSGSAAAVASGMAFAALGTDTGCSIRIPAAFCGLVGLKPTWGRSSLAGGVTLSWSLDHLGPLARSAGDAAALLEVLAGPDPRDGRTLHGAAPFRARHVAGEVATLRVAVVSGDGSGNALAGAEQLAAVRTAAEALERAGARRLELDLPQLDGLRVVGGAILGLEAGAFHRPWLRTRLDDYGEFMRQRVLASFAYDQGAFVRAQQARALLRREAMACWSHADILLLPIHPGPVPQLGVPAVNGLALPFNCLGWPALSMPVGRSTDGLPLAVQLVARPWDEAGLLRAAAVVEGMLR